MATSKEELAKALEALASGRTDAQQDPEQHKQPAVSPQDNPLPPAARVSHSIRPLPGKPGVPAAQRPAAPVNRRLFLRQTVIPPLLTLGVLMPISGVASLLMRDDSPLGEHPLVPIMLILLGLLTLGAAVLNMLQVRQLLSVSGKR